MHRLRGISNVVFLYVLAVTPPGPGWWAYGFILNSPIMIEKQSLWSRIVKAVTSKNIRQRYHIAFHISFLSTTEIGINCIEMGPLFLILANLTLTQPAVYMNKIFKAWADADRHSYSLPALIWSWHGSRGPVNIKRELSNAHVLVWRPLQEPLSMSCKCTWNGGKTCDLASYVTWRYTEGSTLWHLHCRTAFHMSWWTCSIHSASLQCPSTTSWSPMDRKRAMHHRQ
jgi:hypothetical protein